ncbi:MAG: hypothetical protein A2V70_06545 [Planctomycetes bacterium RBG_13_63_9]|nr:MAG: hypothetical protein A2V70_06545 [Planctomycetes bacterium RBG_13_63_9]
MTRRRRRTRLPRLSRRQAIVWLVAIIALALLPFWHTRPEAESSAPDVYRVERVIDGDTLLLANRCRVRLIGADTPETVKPNHPVEPWGPEATRFTKAFVAGGEVRLEYDGPRHDKYERLLAYVWVGEKMLNEELIRAGLARARTEYPYASTIKARFRDVETQARSAGRGIWSP